MTKPLATISGQSGCCASHQVPTLRLHGWQMTSTFMFGCAGSMAQERRPEGSSTRSTAGKRSYATAKTAGCRRTPTLLGCARLAGLKPLDYLTDILQQLPMVRQRDLETILPWSWTPSPQRETSTCCLLTPSSLARFAF